VSRPPDGPRVLRDAHPDEAFRRISEVSDDDSALIQSRRSRSATVGVIPQEPGAGA